MKDLKTEIKTNNADRNQMADFTSKDMEIFLLNTLSREAKPTRMEETIEICAEIMRKQASVQEEKRTGFWRCLSDILRIEGISIFGLQAATLCIACLAIITVAGVPKNIPIFMPLFVLAVLPVLFRGQYYGMSEMEAATRASGAQIMLAKLILAGAANLVGMTVVLCLELYRHHSGKEIGQLILYLLVPYLVCMVIVLWFLRSCKREGASVCASITSGFCVCWGISSKAFPWLYETSAMEIWIIAFICFAAFFIKEIYLIIKMRKEGKMYGIIV